MPKCGNCWFADFDPDSTDLHNVHMEDDLFSIKMIGGKAKQMRVIKSCYVGQCYYSNGYGAEGEHECKRFKEFNKGAMEYAAVEDRRKNELTHMSTRKKMPPKPHITMILQVLYENDDTAFNLMADIIGKFDFVVAEKLLLGLNDMNIRGQQIVSAYMFCKNDLDNLRIAVTGRMPEMVAYVNTNAPLGSSERAIVRGAHRYAHV